MSMNQKNTKTTKTTLQDKEKLILWNKATKLQEGENENKIDPTKYRKDKNGKVIYFYSYNKKSEMGWTLDDLKETKNNKKMTTYHSHNAVEKVWEKGEKIKNKNPNLQRKDVYGNILKYDDYGDDSETGWEIDHIKPKSRGGSDYLRNLQPLQTKINREKSNTLKKKSINNIK